MSIGKGFRNTGRATVLGAAVLAAIPLMGVSSPADAQDRRGRHWDRGDWHRGDWNHRHGWRNGYHRDRYWHNRNDGAGIALGLIGGALAGAAIASAANPYNYPYYSYPYPYSYQYPYYYGYGY